MFNLNGIKNTNILVVGDIMIDIYFYGICKRMSPEAPVPIISINESIYAPGGAGNVAINLSTLGCNVSIAGYIGNDEHGNYLESEFHRRGIDTSLLVRYDSYTTAKSRVLSNNEHQLRFDRDYIVKTDILHNHIMHKKFDAVLVSDYAKGAITPALMSCLREFSCPIICDGKPSNKSLFYDTFCITPNLAEAQEMSDSNGDYEEIAEDILEEMRLQSVVITLAEKGVFCLTSDGQKFSMPACCSGEKIDVTGAGDTMVSALTACIAAGGDIEFSTFASNVAAGVVVQKVGTAFCTFDELSQEIQKYL